MNIAAIRIKNFLSLSQVILNPGKITQISGQNGEGKSSILKAIEFAIQGSTDGSLVKKGEDECEVWLEFDDHTSIRRKIGADGKQSVKVRKGDFAADKPQTLLDGLFGAGAFNPLMLLDSKKRTEVLLSAIPLTIDEKDLKDAMGECPVAVPPVDYKDHGLKVAQQAHKYLFQRRAEANKDAKAASEVARVNRADLSEPERKFAPRPDEVIRKDLDGFKKKIVEENYKDNVRAEHSVHVKAAADDLTRINEMIAETRSQINLLEAQLLAKNETLACDIVLQRSKQAYYDDRKNEPAAAGPDQAVIAAQNTSIQLAMEQLTENATIRGYEGRVRNVETLEATAQKAAQFAKELSASVERVGAPFRSRLIERAKLPIEGLTYEGDEFKLDGCSIDHLSTAEAMKLAIAVARVVAGPTRLICIDRAESLDQESYNQLVEITKDDGFQYFVTKVGEPFSGATKSDRVVKMTEGNAAVLQ